MLGKPKYNFDEPVVVKIDNIFYIGRIAIIDKFGTFFDNTDVHYDVLIEEYKDGNPCLIKHLPESSLRSVDVPTSLELVSVFDRHNDVERNFDGCFGCEYEFDGNSMECVECHKKILSEKEREETENDIQRYKRLHR